MNDVEINQGEFNFRVVLRDFLGGKAGNQSLQEALGWDDETYDFIKTRLIESGYILSGRGKGGSVRTNEKKASSLLHRRIWPETDRVRVKGTASKENRDRKSGKKKSGPTRIEGISIPIAYEYNFRGKHYDEIEIYFSSEPIAMSEIDLVEPGTLLSKKLNRFIKKSTFSPFDALVPYKFDAAPEKINGDDDFPKRWGFRVGIDLMDGNPATATVDKKIGFMPCGRNNIEALLEAFSYPAFYLQVEKESLLLKIRLNNKSYGTLPAQKFSPTCWLGVRHATITISPGGPGTFKTEQIDWHAAYLDIVKGKDGS